MDESKTETAVRYVCSQCGANFRKRSSVLNHVKWKHKKVNPGSQCSLCDKKFTNISNLIRHQKVCASQLSPPEVTDTKLENPDYQCTNCGKTLSSKFTLTRHLGFCGIPELDLTEKIEYTCEECEATFPTMSAVLQHTKWKHNLENPENECNICHKKFSRKSNLSRHFKVCSLTEKELENDYSVNIETIPSPTPESEPTKFTCEVCEADFQKWPDVLEHVKLEHGEYSSEIECNICGTMFVRRSDLDSHSQLCTSLTDAPTEEAETEKMDSPEPEPNKFVCEKCGAIFHHKAALVSHVKWKHETENPENICNLCNRKFTKKSNLSKHTLFCSTLDSKNSCDNCGRKFSAKHSLTRHLERCSKNPEVPIMKYRCALCEFAGSAKAVIVNHYSTDHQIRLRTKQLEFETLQEFTIWKEEFERETKSRFVKNSSAHPSWGFQKHQYACHRDGNFYPHGNNIRRVKSLGTNKINAHCPARIDAYISDEGVKIHYVDTHLGHELDVRRLTVSAAEKAAIAEKVAAKVPFKQILDEIRDSASGDDLSRIHLLSRKDLWNIVASYHLRQDAVPNKGDDCTVDEWVCRMRADSTNLIRRYKPQGVISESFPQLDENDFLLIMMNDVQLQILREFGEDCICIDGIHASSDSLDLQRYTLMVVDDKQRGFPCCFLFTNRADSVVMELFFNTIRKCLNNRAIIAKTFMSDVDVTLYDAWCAVMGPVPYHLYCTWHVDRAWRENLDKIQTANKQAQVYKRLKVLMFETNVQSFDTKSKNLFAELTSDPDTKEFAEYFLTYQSICSTWAYAYRTQNDIDTNVRLENMHKIIKQFHFNRKKVCRLDKAMTQLMKYIRDKHFDLSDHRKGIGNDLASKHKKTLGVVLDCGIEEIDGYWNVSSADAKRVFQVEKNDAGCSCKTRCLECEACVHAFKCTCVDYTMNWEMCSHIHLICMYLKNVGTGDAEIPQGESDGTLPVPDLCPIEREESDGVADSFAKRKTNVLERFLYIFSAIQNDEQLATVAERLAPLQDLLKESVRLPETDDSEPPIKMFKFKKESGGNFL